MGQGAAEVRRLCQEEAPVQIVNDKPLPPASSILQRRFRTRQIVMAAFRPVLAALVLAAIFCTVSAVPLEGGDPLTNDIVEHMLPGVDLQGLEDVRREARRRQGLGSATASLQKRFHVPFFSTAPPTNATFFHSLIKATSNCNLAGKFTARVWHYSVYGSLILDFLVDQAQKLISDPAQKTHFSKVIRMLYTTENEGIKLKASMEILGGRQDVQTSLTNRFGVGEASFKFAAPCKEDFGKSLSIKGEFGLAGTAQVIGEEGWSVISDVDDTIRVSGLLSKLEFMKNTFLRPFVKTPGFPEWYANLNQELASPAWHYVSGMPHVAYNAVREFIEEGPSHGKHQRYPDGSLHMPLIGWTGGDFWLGTSAYKTREIEKLMEAWPRRKYVFVGDSGQGDPEIYGDLYRRWASKVAIKCIYIRKVSGINEDKEQEKNHPDRFRKAFKGISAANWVTFDDPSELRRASSSLRGGKCRYVPAAK